MDDQSISVTKNRGRPPKAPTAVVRLPLETLRAADAWAANQPDQPKTAEAVRRLVELQLERISDVD